MHRYCIPMVLALALVVGCASRGRVTQGTLAELRDVSPDVEEAEVEQGLEQAMQGYRRFLEETPETAMTPEAMRRLADLQIEQQFGISGGDGTVQEMPAQRPVQASVEMQTGRLGPATPGDGALQEMIFPEPRQAPVEPHAERLSSATPFGGAGPGESDEEFEERTTAPVGILAGRNPGTPFTNVDRDPEGPLEAIALYDRLLTEYPSYENSDKVLYQKARAYDELGRTEEAMETMERLINANPHSEHYDEVQFRRGEYFFTRRRYRDAESAYSAIISLGESSSYYELGLYKLGWSFYKQELYEEALHKYMALLDYKVSIGYDFDETHSEEEERRVADTFRAISLSFAYLGGPETVTEYFLTFGNRPYEDRVYSNLGEHYLVKLRYDDAAKTYKAFETLYPFHRAAPHFSMRITEIFTQGGFPMLVLESKREFASKYGLQAEYWRHFTPEESPQVLAYLKTNLTDLATHYHAQYQDTEEPEEKLANYHEAIRWYGDYLESFPMDEDSPSMNYQLADLLLEHEDFGAAARQYERTAYDYEPHSQSAAAGYAAVYAYREQLKVAEAEQQDAVKLDTIASSLNFADTFPDHAQAATVLGAAADDMYEMGDYRTAIESAQRLIETYPQAEMGIRRSAWLVVAHGSFELAEYPEAETAYTQVLALTPDDDESHASLVDNLSASIYKQGELANEAQDYRAAADHFLRIRLAAPTSTIRPVAEYDAGAALIALEAWTEAAGVFEAFRSTYPEHDLTRDATRQIAYAYREDGQLLRAADEYERFASESEDPALRGEALLVAGDLYGQSDVQDRALDTYLRYVNEFPKPVEMNLETRFKIAEIHKTANDESLYHQELGEIVRIDAEAGPDRTGRTRTLAARSALVLAERLYDEFVTVKLVQPFEISLEEKQQRMDDTIEGMSRLVAYEIADVTAAATYYMAETYFEFSRSLTESERPPGLQSEDLEAFEMELDAAAFPFEENAIEMHEENIELLHTGVFNAWTEKSLSRLAEMMPGRYSKHEASSGFISVIESNAVNNYVYRSPVSQIPVPDPGEAYTTPGEPAPPTPQAPVAVDDGG